MAEQRRAGGDPEKRHKAENLAKEAVEELEHGNKDEGKFLAEEARELDPAAADAVLQHRSAKSEAGARTASGRSAKSAKSGASGAKRSETHGARSGDRTRARSGEKRGGSAERTIDHDVIRDWVEARNGRPSVVKRSHDTEEGGGILRIDFNEPEESLEEVPWDEFFEVFEDRNLAFLHQDRTADGHLSRFFKFVRRDEEEEAE